MSLGEQLTFGRSQVRFPVVVAAAGLGLGTLLQQSELAAVGGVALILLAALVSQVARLPATRVFSAALILSSALVDLPGKAHVGGFSANAALTVAYAFIAVLIVVLRPRSVVRQATRPLLPFVVLLSFAALSMMWGSPSVAAFQNLLVLWTFIVGALCGFDVALRRDGTDLFVAKVFGLASGVALALYGAGLVAGGLGTGVVIGSRSFALFALVITAWGAAGWRHHAPWSRSLTVVTGLFILLSLSRTAFAAALVVVCLASLNPRTPSGWLRLLGTVALGIGTAYFAVNHIRPLHDRIYTGDLQTVAGVPINVEGRASIWQTTWDSYLTSPVFGHGVGTADNLVARLFSNAGHPHNDYLRLLHDFGLFGFSLWIIGFVWMLSRCWRSWQGRQGDWSRVPLTLKVESRVHAAAFLALIGVAIAMVTDNVLDYLFVMGPVGVLIGLSFGFSARRHDGSGSSTDRNAY